VLQFTWVSAVARERKRETTVVRLVNFMVHADPDGDGCRGLVRREFVIWMKLNQSFRKPSKLGKADDCSLVRLPSAVSHISPLPRILARQPGYHIAFSLS